MEAEAEVLGVDHAQLGGMVARAWCLPDSLVAGIERHHATKGHAHPDSAELIGYAVHVSDVVAKAVGGGPDDNAEIETFARAMGELGLSADDYDPSAPPSASASPRSPSNLPESLAFRGGSTHPTDSSSERFVERIVATQLGRYLFGPPVWSR